MNPFVTIGTERHPSGSIQIIRTTAALGVVAVGRGFEACLNLADGIVVQELVALHHVDLVLEDSESAHAAEWFAAFQSTTTL